MVLKFPGGVRPAERGVCADDKIETLKNCSAVCLPIGDGADIRLAVSGGNRAKRGSLLAFIDGTPIYSPISGEFRGEMELDGGRYLVVVSGGEGETAHIFRPEERELKALTFGDILDSVRKLGIIDTRSGLPLWKMMSGLEGNCRRVVIDCTESDAASAIAGRICLKKSRSIVGGAKILLHAMSAQRAVIAGEKHKKQAFELLSRQIDAGFPISFARLEVKYPYDDRALIYAIYVSELARNETAADRGCLVVSAETVANVYDCMATGFPMVDRYIGVYGDGIEKPLNLKVPNGVTIHELTAHCGGKTKNAVIVENSLICGDIIEGAIGNSTRALIAVVPKKKAHTACIGCGSCVDACPIRLIPAQAIGKITPELYKNCTGCGCCEFVCPSGIPLKSMITQYKKEKSSGKGALS